MPLELGAAANRLGIPARTLLDAIDAGTIEAVRIPGTRRIGITEAEIERYAAKADR